MKSKMTDNEIIKAVKCCSGIDKCNNCPYGEIINCTLVDVYEHIDNLVKEMVGDT